MKNRPATAKPFTLQQRPQEQLKNTLVHGYFSENRSRQEFINKIMHPNSAA